MICTALLVTDIMNPEVPRTEIFFTSPPCRRIEALVRGIMAFFPVRKRKTQTAETNCDRMVARAAPWIPIFRPKIKTGSRIRFRTAPMETVSIPVTPKPWALMKLFIPRLIMTKTVPRR